MVHYNEKGDKYVVDPDRCGSWQIALSREISQLMKEIEKEEKVKVQLHVEECLRDPAASLFVKAVEYYGHAVTFTPSNMEFEIEVCQ